MNYQYSYEQYYNYQEISDILNKYALEYPQFTKLRSLCVTPQGREVWLMEITDLNTGNFEDKPAFYIEGNIHAGEVTGCMTVMYFLDTIFSNLESEEVKVILENYTIYAVPRLSPDGSEHYLTKPNTLRSSPIQYMYDEENPGLNKKDLDNDGAIRLMRIQTPYGTWKKSKLDSRLMSKRLPDDIVGEFYNVYEEGTILDFDGLNIVQAPSTQGNDFNRNYPFSWQADDKQPGAGDYPLANVETKANADFLIAHPNVCFVLDMHTSGGQNLYTPGYQSRKNTNKEDVELNKTLAKMAEEENKYPAVNIYDEYFPKSMEVGIYGSFCDFCHFMLGIPTIAIECWDLNIRAGNAMSYPPKEEVSEQEKEQEAYNILKWVDEHVAKEDGFKPWQKHAHSQLGEVEIGGYNTKFIFQNPPKGFLYQEVEKHTRFIYRAIKTLPKVYFDKVDIEEISEEVYKIKAVVGNHGYMPTYVFKEVLKNKAFKELSVEIQGDIAPIEGKLTQKIGHLGGIMNMSAKGYYGHVLSVQNSELCKAITWVIKAKKGTTVDLICSGGRIGKVKHTITL